jgi:DNA (cytosine-5)-methyltransferase 1
MAELDARRLSIALLNHPSAIGVAGDLRETLPQVVEAYRDRAGLSTPALLAACPPCQGMSSAQSARGLGDDADAGSRDHRNLLVEIIASAAQQLQPRLIVVENVQAFLTRKVRHPVTEKAISAAAFLIDTLDADYSAYPLLADLADFGIPQSRKRSFLTFLRRSEAAVQVLARRQWAPYPWPSHAPGHGEPITLKDALASFGLPTLDASSPETATSPLPMHSVPVWPGDRYLMVRAIPPNSGLSAWDNDQCVRCGRRARVRARARCSRCGAVLPRPVIKEPGPTRLRLITGFNTSYRRMDPSKPASTVTTASGHVGSDRTIHPWENRVLSPLECALLQTFPRSFKWGAAPEQWGHNNVRAMIGEAVPPLFTAKHGRILGQLLAGVPPRTALSATDARVIVARRALAPSRALATQSTPA